jgi:hypothetical protein
MSIVVQDFMIRLVDFCSGAFQTLEEKLTVKAQHACYIIDFVVFSGRLKNLFNIRTAEIFANGACVN